MQRAAYHTFVFALAALLAWGLQSLVVPARIVAWLQSRDFFVSYTPYFPGMAELGTHQIFSHAAASKKKIVLLGASAVDSIGCDYTWHRPEKGVEPNVHWTCTVASQLNQMLRHEGKGDWQAFSLARNGAKLTDMLFVYSQIAALKPELVVFGDSFNYYMWENSNANGVGETQYAAMNDFYGHDPQTANAWQAYVSTLREHGWAGQLDLVPPSPLPRLPQNEPVARAQIGTLMERGITNLRHAAWAEGMPRPLAFVPYRDWPEPVVARHPFQNPDVGFKYLRGMTLIADKQREFGGRMFVYSSPQWDSSHDQDYVEGVDHVIGGYLKSQGIPYTSMVGMRMEKITETYDGNHQSLLGNRRIAAMLLQALNKEGLLFE